jgi:hypothetical protein
LAIQISRRHSVEQAKIQIFSITSAQELNLNATGTNKFFLDCLNNGFPGVTGVAYLFPTYSIEHVAARGLPR